VVGTPSDSVKKGVESLKDKLSYLSRVVTRPPEEAAQALWTDKAKLGSCVDVVVLEGNSLRVGGSRLTLLPAVERDKLLETLLRVQAALAMKDGQRWKEVQWQTLERQLPLILEQVRQET
jgi:hypothetical protein